MTRAAWVLLLLSGMAQAQPAVAPPEKRNWFDDPFFRVSSGLPDCPVPEGPLYTLEEQRRQAHYRVERGTSCWLAGQCQDSNAYRYDKALASPVESALRAVAGIERSSVWVTIQARVVFLEGCVPTSDLISALEQAARLVPDVVSVVPALNVGTQEPARYTVAPR
jgi:hypothetical protein